MKFSQQIAITILLLFILFTVTASALQAADIKKTFPLSVPVSGMRLDTEARNQVSGLTLTVEDAGWPSLTMLGHPYSLIGALCKTSDHPNEPWAVKPMPFGTVRMGEGGHLTDQQANEVTNTLTYQNDRNEQLTLTVTRLSPAILLAATSKELELFGAKGSVTTPQNSAKNPTYWDEEHQTMSPMPAQLQGPYAPGLFPPLTGCVKPLRWAVPQADGTVLTGILGSQPTLSFPFIDWHKRFTPVSSLAPENNSTPPVDNLGQRWMLLWYGSGSPFLSSKVPAVFNLGGFHVFAPVRLGTAYQADVPFLFVFEKPPQSIELRMDADVSRLVITYPGPAGKIVMLPLFGHDLPAAVTTEKWLQEFPAELKTRCNDWAKRLGDFPVYVNEETSYDEKADRVTCAETFEYVNIRPGGEKMALAPPMLALGLQQKLPAVVTPQPVDLKYATQFGPLLAIPGDRYEWHLDGLGKYVNGQAVIGPSNKKSAVLEKELSAEVDKVLAAGHLAPWIVSRQAPWCANFGTPYGKDPSEILYFLSDMLPVLPEAQQAKVRDYLAKEAAAYSPTRVLQLKVNEGARREFSRFPNGLLPYYDGIIGQSNFSDEYFEPFPSLFRAYGVSRYCQCVNLLPSKGELDFWRHTMKESLQGRDWATLGWFWGKYAIRRKDNASVYDPIPPDYRRDYWQYTPRALHRDAAGLIGYLRLCRSTGEKAEPEAWGQLARLLMLRYALVRYGRYLFDVGLFRMPGTPEASPYNNIAMLTSSPTRMSNSPDAAKQLARSGDFSKSENQFEQVWEVNQHEVTMYSGVSTVANGYLYDSFMASPDNGNCNNQVVFADLTPEVASVLADWGLLDDVARYVKHYAKVQPIWYKSYSDSEHLSESELGLTLARDSYQYFMAHAWIAGTTPEELEQYIDEPWAAIGDFFYMHKLAETIKAYRGVKWKSEE